ncbi:MAG: hypothetical protein WC291_07405, partial [Thermodesulfovibrionales bacterium]
MKDVTLFVHGGFKAYALMWEWEQEAWQWDWNLNGNVATFSAEQAEMRKPVAPRLLPRSYLQSTDYSGFREKPAYSAQTFSGVGTVETAAIETNIFPHSEANLSARGTKLSLTYLTDNAQRTDINRTMAVFSAFDGTAWSAPQAIADDGTADFHPNSITFADGTVIAAWENEKAALPDTATFDEMKQNLDIAAAAYNPTTKTWSGQRAITNNSYLDIAPKLSGQKKGNVMLLWAANEANEIMGSSTAPVTLRYAKYNGSSWSAAKAVGQIPYGLLKYSLLYDGAKAYVVMSLDTDSDTATVNDHELYLLTFESGAWGSLTRLTNDTVPDDNPQLALDPAGKVLLVWLKGNEVSSALDLDMTGRTVVRTDEYSTNLADFKLASSADGKISLIWAEPSEFSSDIRAEFYDPILRVWGSPSQLTADTETERGITAAYYGQDTIIAVYNRNQVGQQTITRTAANGRAVSFAAPTAISTDLYMLRHTMTKDLAFDSGSLRAQPSNPEPGNPVTFFATARNLGDSPAENVAVAFYNGDPGAGGTEIGQTTIAQILKPGDTAEVSFAW